MLVTAAARAEGTSVALVACCPQKRRSPMRTPLHPVPGIDDLALPRSRLGLANLAHGDAGVEASRDENLGARARRLALHRLLSRRGVDVEPGAELEGLNRRVARGPLARLVERAFAARGLAVPSDGEVRAAGEWAGEEHARMRRLSVPRGLLARPLEVYLLLDRAALLVRAGRDVQIGIAWPASVSPRNLVLLAGS